VPVRPSPSGESRSTKKEAKPKAAGEHCAQRLNTLGDAAGLGNGIIYQFPREVQGKEGTLGATEKT